MVLKMMFQIRQLQKDLELENMKKFSVMEYQKKFMNQ